MGDGRPVLKEKLLFQNIPPPAGALLIAATANALAEGLTPSEINVLANFVAAVGDILGYIASQAELNLDKDKT